MEQTFEEKFNSIYTQALQLNSQFQLHSQNHQNLVKQYEASQEELKAKVHTHLVYEQAIEYFKEILQLLSQSHIQHIEQLLNTSVKQIFFDRDYEIKMIMGEYKNSNTLEIQLIETKPDGEKITTNIKDNGFGVKSIVGFILQIYFILYYKLAPVLFMDEAFTYLSSQYIPYLKELIKELSETYKFIFVLVSHDNRLIDISDKVYTVQDGKLV